MSFMLASTQDLNQKEVGLTTMSPFHEAVTVYHGYSTSVPWSSGLYWGRGGPDYPGIRTTEGGTPWQRQHTKNHHSIIILM
jgi:hypothetical protein